jgi:RHS repeat-associated protein
MSDSVGNITRYGYDAQNNLVSVTYPDSTPAALTDNPKKTYVYNESSNTANFGKPNLLTGVIDENGVRFATYKYDSQGRAISTEHAGGVEKYSLNFNANGYQTSVTDPRGTIRTTNFTTVLGVIKTTGSDQPAGVGCAASASNISYDANGNLASRTDFNGNLSCYAYDLSRNLETVRVEGLLAGSVCPANLSVYTPAAGSSIRKITTQWHTTYRLPTQIDQAGQRSSFSYDANGNLLSKTVTDTATGQSRSWTYSYNSLGQILSENGPRNDVIDLTSYSYYSDSTADYKPGDLRSIRNALGHTTTFTAYDGNGRLLSLTDPNGLLIGFRYDPRGRLIQKTVDGHASHYTYDKVGNLTQTTTAAGVTHTFTYDAVHRLTDITDALGGNIHYTLDAMGNRIQEDIQDEQGNLVKTRSRVFDALSRLQQDIDAYNHVTHYEYDANGNLTQFTDAAGHATQHQYDSLDRLIRTTDALNGQTDYDYDGLDRLTQVTDANNHSTTYSYNSLGDLLQLDSPNTGTMQYSYDNAGNLEQKTDAGGVTANYNYDALNRLLGIDYPGTEADITNGYDGTAQNLAGQIGQLTGTRRGDIDTAQQFDLRGNLTVSRVKTIGTNSLISDISYRYNADDQLYETQPSANRRIQNLYDAAGQIKRVQVVDTDVNGTTTHILADGISHLPFGPIKSLSYGNSLTMSRQYDQDYRLTQETAGTLFNQRYGYEATGNLQFIEDDTRTVGPLTFGYDPLGRLASFAVGPMTISYQYDAVGNRIRLDHPLYTEDYHYALDSQRLLSKRKTYTGIGYSETINYQSSTQGFINQTQQRTEVQTWRLDATPSLFDYDADQRFTGSHYGTTVLFKYRYDAFGRRVIKNRLNTPTVNFAYDPENHLIAESKGNSPIHYVYLDDQPLARIDGNGTNSSLYYFHNNHLGAPVRVSNQVGAVVWSDEYDPFANGPFGQANPINPGITQNLRLPGQYNDEERASTNPQHYNMARYYDPGTGRYWQSDPIELMGGLNTYAYAYSNPVNLIDPDGRSPLLILRGLRLLGTFLPMIDLSMMAVDDVPAGGIGNSCPVTRGVSNPVPSTVARVVPDNPITRASGTLGRPGANDVFVTAADDIRGLNAKQIAERLTIPESPTGFRVIEFPTPKSGIASPVNRTDPGFIGGGRTAGAAREFVIPNGAIPAGSSTRGVP